MNSNFMCTPGRNGRAVGGDKMRASCWGRGMMWENATGCSSVNEEEKARSSIGEVQQGASGESGIYDPPAVQPFPS